MNSRDHNSLHGSLNKDRLNTKDFKEKRLRTLNENGFYDVKYTEKKKLIGIQNFKNYMKTSQFKEDIKNNGKRGKKYLIQYSQSDRGRTKSKEIANRKYLCNICNEYVKSPIGLHNHRMRMHANHTVIMTETVIKREDVYCLNVERYHNFALAAGVFVHNCGMHAVKTPMVELSTDHLKEIMGEIRKKIPVGFNHRKESFEQFMPKDAGTIDNAKIICRQFESACHQIGTLGGGNHFIEIQKDSVGYIWFMIHSGSRNLGKQVCDHYNKLAKELNAEYFSSVDPKWDLAFFPKDSEEGVMYVEEMNYCLEFAKANRQLMADDIKDIFRSYYAANFLPMLEEYDVHHNYLRMEHHFGENVIVHRKGATRAYKDEIGIIPGSQGTKSYIVKGMGNAESFMSCSHGAGRALGRGAAKRTLNLQDEQKKLDDQGIFHAIRGVDDLDEAAGAYKNITEVMDAQSDLVEIVTELSPLGVIKG
jgi:tRNA-splicing ligase RtcB